MRIAFFSAKSYDKTSFLKHIGKHYFDFFDVRLYDKTAYLSAGFDAVCVFVNDKVDADTLTVLAKNKVRLVLLRCAGYNNIDIQVAKQKKITVLRVPTYSPHAVAEHAVCLILAANRKIHKAYARIREGNFSLEHLLGFNVYKKTVAVIGTGNIGTVFCELMLGFGCTVLAYDIVENEQLKNKGVIYLPLMQVLKKADIVSLHCPLNDHTHHIINSTTMKGMKKGVLLVNTSRGGLIDHHALIRELKKEKIGFVAMDVYENEGELFFTDHSNDIIKDDILMRLLSFPNVLISGHQAFFTVEALDEIALTTIHNVEAFENKTPLSLANKVV